MTEVDVEPGPGDSAGPVDPWAAYLAAAQRLDGLRRGAASASAEQAQAVGAARQELDGVRARLAPQRSRLVESGVPDSELNPTAADLAAAASVVAGGPAATLAALRQARATADLADAAIVSRGGRLAGGSASAPWLRNLLVYGPFALVVLVVQIALYLTAGSDSLPGYALLCGLTMPLAAFALGWVTIGLVFPPAGGSGRVERSPLVGAVVCFAPVVLSCVGVGLLSVLR